MQRHNMFFGSFLAFLFISFLVSGVFAAASTTTAVYEFPINSDPEEPFSYTCSGEEIILEGNVHVTAHYSLDNTGRIHSKTLTNYNNVTGTGPHEEEYRVSGVLIQNVNSIDNVEEIRETRIQRIKLHGPKRGQTYVIEVTMHQTMTADGEFAVQFTKGSGECVSK